MLDKDAQEVAKESYNHRDVDTRDKGLDFMKFTAAGKASDDVSSSRPFKKGTVLFSGATAGFRGGAKSSIFSCGKFALRALSQVRVSLPSLFYLPLSLSPPPSLSISFSPSHIFPSPSPFFSTRRVLQRATAQRVSTAATCGSIVSLIHQSTANSTRMPTTGTRWGVVTTSQRRIGGFTRSLVSAGPTRLTSAR